MTQRARRQNRRARGSSVRQRVLITFGALFGLVLLALGGVAMWVYSVAAHVNIDHLKPVRQGSNSVVFDAAGTRLGYIQSDTIRRPVETADIPLILKQATVSIEDKNFYKHGGIDPSAIARAAIADLEAGSAVQGGSTITQQLVRNLYISNPQDDITRKIREAAMANQFESKHSKNWILTKYLNTASYGTTDGRTAVGVQAAAETYFNKSVHDLNLPEAALVAGLPQAPTDYNPLTNPKAALHRRNEVLQALDQQGYIKRAAYESALQSGLGLDRGFKYETIKQPYFFDYVQQQLIDKYGVNTVRNGGLKVYTTIDPALQADAQAAVDACAVCYSGGGPQAALASVDATNGHILAMASSTPYSATSQFNFASSAHRQPGSSFKPYVLAAALEQGMDPDTTYYSGSGPLDLSTTEFGPWSVSNAGDGEGGTMDVRNATIDSVNVIFAQLDLDVGPDNVRDMAYKLGITSHLDGLPAEGIGGLRIGVTPLEQADAYASFADGGVHHDATAIAKVEFPNGKSDVPDEEGTRAISDGIAYEVTDILKEVITGGTGYPYTDFGCPAAGKTGTTEGESDAWFVGYTPRISTAVWVGHPESRDLTGYGGPTAGPIWRSYMEAAHGSYCGDFPQPTDPFSPSSSWSGAHTVSSSSATDGTGSSTSGGGSYVPPSTDSTGKYPSQYYAPGAGAAPSPAPAPDTGTGSPPATGGPPPSAGPPSGGGAPGGGTGTGGTG